MVTTPIRSIALAAVVLVAPHAARAETWATYRNARFGVSAQYPSSWIALPPPANGDGRRFRAPGATATITISGAPIQQPVRSELTTRGDPDEGEQVTYTRQGPNWVVVSGIQKDATIFYRKTVIACGTAGTIAIEYPVSEKRRYDSLVSRAAGSLNADCAD